MELGQVHKFVKEVREAQAGRRITMMGPHRPTREEMELYNAILAKPMLETVKVDVLVKYPWMEDAVWEQHTPVFDYTVNEGTLNIRTAGFDLDGDWSPLETITYAEGTWFKFSGAVAEPVDNPYFSAPVAGAEGA